MGDTKVDPRTLPPLFGLAVAAPHLDLSKAAVYALAKTGGLPVPVVFVGSRMKVRRVDLLKFLGLDDQASTEATAFPRSLAKEHGAA
ncbi:helix-turn-helix domain-containing protein [Lentzea flava]|uniref:Helix-turn-helix domain-containing protein n=1 Tax=Lentzea flava TaxID=103732 RepID=A0ABQ2V1L1_9PSEU|nr:helix-turn-helix domain-containing protein [Lentzea flava]MCP2202710.1 hypothetical protein [Lentzea flava]GGU61756.1 hypothetical protein GCM10010178_62420 [Lentzea flava]